MIYMYLRIRLAVCPGGKQATRAYGSQGKKEAGCGFDSGLEGLIGEEAGKARRQVDCIYRPSVDDVLLAMTFRRMGEICFGRRGQRSPRSTRLSSLRPA